MKNIKLIVSYNFRFCYWFCMFQSNKGMLIKQGKLLETDVRLSASTERKPELIKLEVIMKINEIDEIHKP